MEEEDEEDDDDPKESGQASKPVRLAVHVPLEHVVCVRGRHGHLLHVDRLLELDQVLCHVGHV